MYLLRLSQPLKSRPAALRGASALPLKGGSLYADPRPLRHYSLQLIVPIFPEVPLAVVTQSDGLAVGAYRPQPYRVAWSTVATMESLLELLWELVQTHPATLVVAQRKLPFQIGKERAPWWLYGVGLRLPEAQKATQRLKLPFQYAKQARTRQT